MRQQSGRDEGEHRVAGGQQNLRLRLERLGLQAMLQRRPALLRGDLDIALAGGVQRVGVPAQRLRLFDRALHVVAERTRPVDRELRAEFVADLHRVLARETSRTRGLAGASAAGLRGPDGVMERLGGHHGALDAVVPPETS